MDAVDLLILRHGLHRTGIQICAYSVFRAIHKRDNRENAAARPHIQKFRIGRHILFNLSDTKSRRLVHTCAEGCTRVNVQNLLIPVLLLHFLPRGNHEKIIYVKLMEILLPVIDPVNILSFGHRDSPVSDIHELTNLLQSLPDPCEYSLFVRTLRHSAQIKRTIFPLLHKEAKVGNPVVRLSFRQDIHKHLLFFQRRKGHFVLDLCPLKPPVVELADYDILRLHNCLYFKFHPLHCGISPFYP